MELKQIIQTAMGRSFSYEGYRDLVASHVARNTNSGAEVTEDLAAYTVLNNQRMKRLDKTTNLQPETVAFLAAYVRPVTFLIITETWCGDGAQTMPVIQKVAQAAGIDFKVVLRDDNLKLMDQFLTNGARAVAKLIVVDKTTGLPLASWGPRPTRATVLVAKEKATKGELSPAFKEELQNWYNTDKGKDIENDLMAMLNA
jgi:thiol-disulfide isomerase/thioredoxin